ncbi:hypothetical protein SDC9_113748 [bioreactor metagenome]|uniref:Uncharacterized protein n=1 Tax=bioreactor metagenome TaxID=1076179 RepID=A0A645BN96_9ZZZZ
MGVDQCKVTVGRRHAALDVGRQFRKLFDRLVGHEGRYDQGGELGDRDMVAVGVDQKAQSAGHRHGFHQRLHQQLELHRPDGGAQITAVGGAEFFALGRFHIVGLDHQNAGKHFVHPGNYVGDLAEGGPVDLADFAADDHHRQQQRRRADQQHHRQDVIAVLHADDHDGADAGGDFNRAAGDVGDRFGDGVFDGRGVVGAAADQMSDVVGAVEGQRLPGQRSEDLVTHVGDDLGSHPAHAVVIDIGSDVLERPHHHEEERVKRENLPAQRAVLLKQRHCDAFGPGDGQFGLALFQRQVVALGVMTQPVQGFGQLGIGFAFGRIDRQLDGEQPFFPVEGLPLRIVFDQVHHHAGLGRNLDFAVRRRIDRLQQLRHRQQPGQQRTPDQKSGRQADGQALPIRFGIFQQPPVALGIELFRFEFFAVMVFQHGD